MTIKQRWRAWRMRRLAKRAKSLFRVIDRHMAIQKWPRWRRQQWWRDYIKTPYHSNIMDAFQEKGEKR